MVGYWNLDDAASPALDSSSSGDNGTWSSGVTRVTSALPPVSGDVSALSFNGSNGYVSLGVNNLPANNAAQSISVWFKGIPDTNNHNMIAMSNLGSGSAVQLGFRGASLIAWNYGGGSLVSMTAPVDGAWHHVAYTYDGTTDSLYLDGTLSATSTTGVHQTATPTSAYLGTYDGASEPGAARSTTSASTREQSHRLRSPSWRWGIRPRPPPGPTPSATPSTATETSASSRAR